MNIEIQKSLEALIMDWQKSVRDIQTRTTDSTDVYASWQGEAKAYSTAIEDIRNLMNQPWSNFNFASEVVIFGWSQQAQIRLRYTQEYDETTADQAEREKSVETLKWCANQLASVLGKVKQNDLK